MYLSIGVRIYLYDLQVGIRFVRNRNLLLILSCRSFNFWLTSSYCRSVGRGKYTPAGSDFIFYGHYIVNKRMRNVLKHFSEGLRYIKICLLLLSGCRITLVINSWRKLSIYGSRTSGRDYTFVIHW